MGIDLTVSSLAAEWSRYADASVERLASVGLHVPLGDPRRGGERFHLREATEEEQHDVRPSVERAVRCFQEALSARFDRTIFWIDPVDVDEFVGQIDPRASLAVHEVIKRVGADRFPNLSVLDIENMYLPVELPAVLVGEPRCIGSAPGLAREIAELRQFTDDEPSIVGHLDMLDEACEMAMETNAVVFVTG